MKFNIIPDCIHPFLVALFPVLSLYAYNIGQVPLVHIVFPAAIVSVFTAVSWFLLNLVVRNHRKSALIVSLFLFLFFSYGHFVGLIQNYAFQVVGVTIGPFKIIGLLSGILFASGVSFALKTRWQPYKLTALLNWIAVVFVLVPLINISSHHFRPGVSGDKLSGRESLNSKIGRSRSLKYLPDIYYIILDGYAREDVLREIYDYDNTEFLDFLRAKGFYIANQSRSNYCQTNLSIASSLNMNYLDTLVDEIGTESRDRKYSAEMIKNNIVFSDLMKLGYKIVTFSSGYWGTEIQNVDTYITPGIGINLFQNELINSTPLSIIFFRLKTAYLLHRKLILFTFEKLGDIPTPERPALIFAHIVSPHPPFVFGPEGETITPNRNFRIADGSHWFCNFDSQFSREAYIEAYKKQLQFINVKTRETIEQILFNSPDPPIIILQSDHGPGSMLNWDCPYETNYGERLSILNAYYFPGNDNAGLYPSITPVNTFRVVFNRYFGTDYEILDDRSYFSTWGSPYTFINIDE